MADVTEQSNPVPGIEHVQHLMDMELGHMYPSLMKDVWKKAEQAQEKYQLKELGLFTFNGRISLKDAYTDLVDTIVYLHQVKYENASRRMGSEPPVADDYTHTLPYLIALADRMRQDLEERYGST